METRPEPATPIDAFRPTNLRRSLVSSVHARLPAVTEIQGAAGHGLTAPVAQENAYLVQLRLRDCPRCDYFLEGRHIERAEQRAGLVEIHDLNRDARADIQDPFHLVHLYLPATVLGDFAYEAGLGSTGALHVRPGTGYEDAVAGHLFRALLPALARPEEASQLFVDQVAQALTVHVAQQYGGLDGAKSAPRGGLAPWQQRRVTELMDVSIKTDIPMALLAAECGLSTRHFSRAFRQSFGAPPHQFLLHKRVELAKRMMLMSPSALQQIAADCGFANQSHFSRVFASVVGVGPAQWRRISGGR